MRQRGGTIYHFSVLKSLDSLIAITVNHKILNISCEHMNFSQVLEKLCINTLRVGGSVKLSHV